VASTGSILLTRLLGAAKYLLAIGLVIAGIAGLVLVIRSLNADDLGTTLDRVDLASKLLTSAAIIVGGIWALFTFDLLRTGVPSVQLTIAPEVFPTSGGTALVLLSIGMKNVGRVSARAGRHGCILSVHRQDDQPECGHLFDPGRELVTQDLFEHYGSGRRVYLDPGSELHESCALIVKPGTLLRVQADFNVAGVVGPVVTETRHVYVPERREEARHR
jgi:hypothetical protein